jgi:hypothetical protein
MAIAKAHAPAAPALRLVAGPDRRHHPRQRTQPAGRWPDGPPQPGTIGHSDQACGVANYQ